MVRESPGALNWGWGGVGFKGIKAQSVKSLLSLEPRTCPFFLMPYALAASPVGQGKGVTNTDSQCCRERVKGRTCHFLERFWLCHYHPWALPITLFRNLWWPPHFSRNGLWVAVWFKSGHTAVFAPFSINSSPHQVSMETLLELKLFWAALYCHCQDLLLLFFFFLSNGFAFFLF